MRVALCVLFSLTMFSAIACTSNEAQSDTLDVVETKSENTKEGNNKEEAQEQGNVKYFIGKEEVSKAEAQGKTHSVCTYDDMGNRTSERRFGADGKPTVKDMADIHLYEYTYSAAGNKTSESYFDQDGNPTTDMVGIHHREWTYDSAGNKASESYFGGDDEPVADAHGIHCNIYTYDEDGNQTSAKKFDAAGSEMK